MTDTPLSFDDKAALKVFKALGNATRYQIVRMLTVREELGCGELAETFGLSAPALSHHTNILQECGLIEVRREGAFHFFRLNGERLGRYAPSLASSAEGS